MKKNNIKEFEITKEMYKRAKEVEELYKKTGKLNCRTEEFRKLNNKTWELTKKFEKEFTEEFDTLEIVNEYERRERKMNKLEKKFIKTIVKEILTIEAEALQYTDYSFADRYEVEDFAEGTYGTINYYINIMVDRCVSKNIVNQLVDLNLQLYDRNARLKVMYGYNYKY